MPKGNRNKLLKYSSSEASVGDTKTLAVAGGSVPQTGLSTGGSSLIGGALVEGKTKQVFPVWEHCEGK